MAVDCRRDLRHTQIFLGTAAGTRKIARILNCMKHIAWRTVATSANTRNLKDLEVRVLWVGYNLTVTEACITIPGSVVREVNRDRRMGTK